MEQKNHISTALFANPREDWLALVDEDVADPGRIIVDSHHHFWDLPVSRYMVEEFLADVNSGHAISSSVYVECKSMYRSDGPMNRRSVGEVEFVRSVAEASENDHVGSSRICSAIVGGVDFRTLGDEAEDILVSLVEAGKGRLRGIRQPSNWTADRTIGPVMPDRPPYLLLDEKFRQGFFWLSRVGLSFDAFIFHPQIPDLIDLATAFPDTKIVLDHLGGPIGVVRSETLQEDVFNEWRVLINELAKCPNVSIKLGGLGSKFAGFDFHSREKPPSSDQAAEAWRPFIETAIEAFGTKRSMFESNFPPDKGTCSYRTLWNAFKKIAASFSEDEKDDLFSGTARAFYRL